MACVRDFHGLVKPVSLYSTGCIYRENPVGKIENRKELRRPLRYRACVVAMDGRTLGLCMVSDVSETGARLENPIEGPSGHIIDIPDQFILMLARRRGTHRKCVAVWRSEHYVGVQFQRDVKTKTAAWKPTGKARLVAGG